MRGAPPPDRGPRRRGCRAAHLVQPGEHVAPPVAARHAGVAPDRQDDVTTGPAQLGGQLLAARAGADHEHAAGRQFALVAVPRRVELHDVLRHLVRAVGHARDIAVAGGDHDVASVPVAAIRRHVVAVRRRADPLDGRALANRRTGGVGLEVADDAAAIQVTVGIAQGRSARQPVEPVRRQQGQRVPALGAPALSDAPALEHDVPVAGHSEVVAEGQPGLTGPDDDGVDVHVNAPRAGGRERRRQGSRTPDWLRAGA